MEKEELFYKLALSKVDGIGAIKYKKLLEEFGSAKAILKATFRQLKLVQGLGQTNICAIRKFADFGVIEKEMEFAEKNSIQILDLDNLNYPTRLKQCIDPPSVLFYKGNADLNHPKVISVIGTRMYTEYGKRICEELIDGLKPYDVLVPSGLAFGIDAIAHKACLRIDVPTVGVVAHGLDSMYPGAHLSLSKQMQQHGGLLSEYFSNTRADKRNFPTRNRIVAGMADATVIVETDIRGGSMITAEIAYSYNRDVFCVPGRITDEKSNGCNHLIKTLKGQLITSADDIANSLGWTRPKSCHVQRQLFIELTVNEQLIMDFLKSAGQMHIDEFYTKSILSSSELAASLLSLEMQHIIRIMPGKLVTLVD